MVVPPRQNPWEGPGLGSGTCLAKGSLVIRPSAARSIFSFATIGAVACVLPLSFAACGTESSTFDTTTHDDAGGDGGSGEFGDSGPNGVNAACVNHASNGQIVPVNLIVIYDKSGSMGDTTDPNGPYDPAKKWTPVGTGMKAFLGDPSSAGMSASLQYFPLGNSLAEVCDTATYATPAVALKALPDGAFATSIDATSPRGGTPTLPALQSAITYAKTIAAQKPSDKSAVVLVTDGEPSMLPTNCADNDINHVALAAAAGINGSPSIPTYVIGVGSSLINLNQIAASGGTKQALIVDVSDPTKTQTDFVKALTQIRGETLSCDFVLPAAPAGQALDLNTVNVVLTQNGKDETLGYDKDCAGAAGGGWHYDSVGAPTKVELCPGVCDTAKKAASNKITITLGCATKGGVK